VTERNKLSVRPVRQGLIEESEDRPFELSTHDLTLPCRRFQIEHKVAEVGKVSLTAEFLLRFLRSMGSSSEEAVQSFFGYSRREMAYVLNEVEEADFVQRLDGRLSLTTTGHSLFRQGVEEPLIFEVERKIARAGFDLISLAPAEKRYLNYFDANLPELPLQDQRQVSSATEQIPASFRRFFRELTPRSDPTATARRTLYSIDSVTAQERFLTLVRVRLIASGLKPTHADVDLSDWRSEYELADREPVARAIAEVVEGLTVNRRSDDPDAYQLLVDLAPDYLKEWVRRDGLNVERYYRHAFTSQGDVRADRKTTPIVGSLFTQENARRLFDVATYGLRKMTRTSTALLWIVPQVPLWGSTSVLYEMIEQLRGRLIGTNEDLGVRRQAEAVVLTAGRPERWLKEAFNSGYESDARVLPGGFELLLIPGCFVAAMVHAPIGQQSGLPVPLGFASFDDKVVGRATTLVESLAPAFQLSEDLRRQLAVPQSDEERAEETEGDVRPS
jgi:hypothetical protein